MPDHGSTGHVRFIFYDTVTVVVEEKNQGVAGESRGEEGGHRLNWVTDAQLPDTLFQPCEFHPDLMHGLMVHVL